VARRDQHRRFRFAPIQGAVGRRVARAIGINPDQPDSFAVILDGRPFFKSEGAIAILQRLPGWRWTSILLMVPAPFRNWLYDRVARNRYRLFGRLDMCIVPTAELQAHMYHEVP
jgi:predicted DCC family thiol-disulfide oxidoreductase YuxK